MALLQGITTDTPERRRQGRRMPRAEPTPVAPVRPGRGPRRGSEGGRAPTTNPLPSRRRTLEGVLSGDISERDAERLLGDKLDQGSLIDSLRGHPITQAGEWLMDVYRGADETVRGLPRAAQALGSQTPDVIARDMVGQSIENWRHPVTYANRDPFGYTMDVLGLGTFAAGTVPRLASRARMLDLADETGAINLAGRALEEGDVTDFWRTSGDVPGPSGISPRPRRVQFRTGGGDVHEALLKTGDQLASEIASSELMKASGLNPRIAGGMQFSPNEFLVEMIDDPGAARAAMAQANRAQMVEDARGISLWDYVIGNTDRALGANLGTDAGRLAGFDQGMAFSGFPESAIRRGIYNLPENRGVALRQTEYDALLRAAQRLQQDKRLQGMIGQNISERGVERVLERIKRVLDENALPDPTTHGPTYEEIWGQRM